MKKDGIRRADRAGAGGVTARRNQGTGPGGSGVQPGESAQEAAASTLRTRHRAPAASVVRGPVESGFPTADASALAEDVGEVGGEDLEEASDLLSDADLGDLTVHAADDPDLGLTNVGDLGPDDWAADTGPTRSGESESHGVTNELAEEDGTLKAPAKHRGRR